MPQKAIPKPMTFPPRYESIVALENAIASYKRFTGPGKWSVDRSHRFLIALTWTCQNNLTPSDFDGEKPWKEFGGNDILAAAGVWSDQILAGDEGDGHYLSSAIIGVRGYLGH
jgi:hypothetical protein